MEKCLLYSVDKSLNILVKNVLLDVISKSASKMATISVIFLLSYMERPGKIIERKIRLMFFF